MEKLVNISDKEKNDLTLKNLELTYEIQQLEHTIEFAKFRCIPISKIIHNLSKYKAGDFVDHYLSRLSEVKLTNKEYNQLIESIDKIIDSYSTLSSKEKIKVENFISRLIIYLPSKLRYKYFDIFINCTRKTGRKIAYKAIYENSPNKNKVLLLVSIYLKKREQEALKAIIYSPIKLDLETISLLLEKIDEEYWKARLIENVLRNKQKEISSIYLKYPFEFVHAVGRIGNKEYLNMTKEAFEENKGDLDFLSIYAYTLGKLGAKKELTFLGNYINDLKGYRGQALKQDFFSWILRHR